MNDSVRKMHGMRIIRTKDDSTYQVDVTNCISYHFYRVIGTFTLSGSSSNQISHARFLQILDLQIGQRKWETEYICDT